MAISDFLFQGTKNGRTKAFILKLSAVMIQVQFIMIHAMLLKFLIAMFLKHIFVSNNCLRRYREIVE